MTICVQKYTSIKSITTGSDIPVAVASGEIKWGNDTLKSNILARIMYCGYDFNETLQMKMASGRFYSEKFATDSVNAIVVNEEVAKIMRWKDPIGQRFLLWDQYYQVIGVAKNILFQPFNFGGCAMIIPFTHKSRYLFIRISQYNQTETIARIREVFEKYISNYPFEYNYLIDFQ